MRKENGVLYFRENWFLKYVWRFNSLHLANVLIDALFVFIGASCCVAGKPKFPKSLCSLFWGSLLGIILTPFCFMAGIFGCLILSALFVIEIILAAFFGYYFNFAEKSFWPYKHWGEKRIPVAAWEVCAVPLGFYLIYSAIKYSSAVAASIMMYSFSVVVLLGTLFLIGFIGFLAYLFKTTPGKVAHEYIKAAKRKVCPLVVIEPSEK